MTYEQKETWQARHARERLERVRMNEVIISAGVVAALSKMVPPGHEPTTDQLISALCSAIAEALEQLEERRIPGIL